MQYSKEEKAKCLEDWKLSGKSISAYTKENGIVRRTFTKWLKAHRNLNQCFVEITVPPIQASSGTAQILIEKGGIKIHVPLSSGCHELRAIIEGLKAVQ
jgi:transposase-like protein